VKWFWFVFPKWLVIFLSTFSFISWPLVCLLWRNIRSHFCAFKNQFLFSSICSEYHLLVRCIICISCLWFLRLSFHSINCSSYCEETFQVGVVVLVYFCFYCLPFGVIAQKSLTRPMSSFFLMYSSRSITFQILHVSLWSILNWFLFYKGPILFFCMWVSSLPQHTINYYFILPYNPF
jgi:hypothetical protein